MIRLLFGEAHGLRKAIYYIPNVQVTRGAFGVDGSEPKRYGFSFLYEKIVSCGRNGKTCNEIRATYGCGP